MRLRISILLFLCTACAEPVTPTIPPVTSAHPETTPPPAASGEALHAVRAKLATNDAELFVLHRGEKEATCEKAIVKPPPPDKAGKRVLEIDASSTTGCWTGRAMVMFELAADQVSFTETRIMGPQTGFASRCVTPRLKDQPAANVETVSDTELRIEGTSVFSDEASCKKSLANTSDAGAPTGCLAKGVASAVGARKPPPKGAFVERFEKLIKDGGTVWTPAEAPKTGCILNKLTSKREKVKDKDILRVSLTSNSVEGNTRWVDTTDYDYDPVCRRAHLSSIAGEGTNPDGTKTARASSAHTQSSDLSEDEDVKDALPIVGPVFYTQNACAAWVRAQGTASSK